MGQDDHPQDPVTKKEEVEDMVERHFQVEEGMETFNKTKDEVKETMELLHETTAVATRSRCRST